MKEQFNNPLVSIVIPTYNRVETVAEAIECLLKQTYSNIEIIIVNDNGEKFPEVTKKLEERLEPFFLKLKERLKYIKLEKNSGGAVARNTGLKNASGKYISFLDDDEEYRKDKIEKQVEILENSENKVAFVGCNRYFNEKIVSNKKKYYETDNMLKTHIMNQHGIVETTVFMFRKDVVDEVNGFEVISIRQEYMLILKILEKGYVGKYVEENLVRYKDTGESLTRSKNEKKVADMRKVLDKRLSFLGKVIDEKEAKKINNDFYLDLIDWYHDYKRLECLKYYFKINKFQISLKDNVKIFLMTLFGKKYECVKSLIINYN